MAHSVTPLNLQKLPLGPAPLTADETYWRAFKTPKVIATPTKAAVNSITSALVYENATRSDIQSDAIAITAGTRIMLLDSRARTVTKQISRFTHTAHSAHFRPSDGRVLVAGDESGAIQVFDTKSRAILKTWKGTPDAHRQGVWVTRFSPFDATAVMSASDDCTVREWELTADAPVRVFDGHSDYVRAGAYMPGSQARDLLVSGSYDQTVRIWDRRAPGRAALTFKHNAPVEAVLPSPSGTTVLAAAGEQISVLDLVGGRPLHILKNHQKTVTSLCLASKSNRLVSGALDGHVKMFEMATWSVVAGTKYPSPVLAVSVVSSAPGQDDRHLIVGMQAGSLSIRTKLAGAQKAKERERRKEMEAMLEGKLDEYDEKIAKKRKMTSGWRARLRGRDFTGEGADVIIEGEPKTKPKKLKPWEHDLRNARYSAALDQVLEAGDPNTIVTLFIALRHRSATRTALGNRDEVTLQPVLRWICKHIIDPRHTGICVEVGVIALDIYAVYAGQSHTIDKLLQQLHSQVRREIDRAEQAWQTNGMLGLLMTS